MLSLSWSIEEFQDCGIINILSGSLDVRQDEEMGAGRRQSYLHPAPGETVAGWGGAKALEYYPRPCAVAAVLEFILICWTEASEQSS